MVKIKSCVKDHKNIIYWDKAKNEKNGLFASKVGQTSAKRAWWICAKGHSYCRSVRTQLNNPKCPICNSLAYNFPELECEWGDNGKSFNEVSQFSSKKVNWVCSEGHKYTQTVVRKTRGGCCCPYCYGRYPSEGNNLLTKVPRLKQYWSGNNTKKMTDYLPSSTQKVLWICPIHGEYEQRVVDRVKANTLCPYCSGHRVGKGKSFGDKHPEYIPLWSSKNKKSIYETTERSGEKVWWNCPTHGEYMQVVSRKGDGAGCPMCSGHKASKENNLANVFPELSTSWVASDNGEMSNYTPFSNKKVTWVCPIHGKYIKRVVKRTKRLEGCPLCSIRITVPNKIIACRYRHYSPSLEHKVVIKGKAYYVDVYLEQLNTIIEFDSLYYHKDKLDKDVEKTKKLLKEGFNVIRVREPGLPDFIGVSSMEKAKLSIVSTNKVIKHYTTPLGKENIHNFLGKVDSILGETSKINLDKIYSEVRVIE